MASLSNVHTSSCKQARISVSKTVVAKFRPFTSFSKHNVKQTRVFAAAEESAPAENEFTFNFSEAKRNNDFNPSDVDAALRYFNDGEGSMVYEADHYINHVDSVEDAAVFDELENVEAYDLDEFAVVGISEAAPRGRRKGDDSSDDKGEELTEKVAEVEQEQQLREAAEMKGIEADIEDMGIKQMVASAGDKISEGGIVSQGVWDWMDPENTTASADEVTAAFEATEAGTPESGMMRDAAWFTEGLTEETRDLVSLMVDDFDLDKDLVMDPKDDDDEGVMEPTEPLAASITDSIDAVLATPIDEVAPITATPLPVSFEQASTGIEQAEVDAYLSALSQFSSSTTGGQFSQEEIDAMFTGDLAGAIETVSVSPVPAGVEDVLSLEAAALTFLEPAELQLAEDVEDSEANRAAFAQVAATYNSLLNLELPKLAESLPSDAEMEEMERLLSAVDEYNVMQDQRKEELLAAVRDGQLPVSALDEDDGDDGMDDFEDALLAGEDDYDVPADEYNADDLENQDWQERVIELRRVTKVVKGGKLMGFRAVAIIGNLNGLVGVGVAAGREVGTAVKRAIVDAKKNLIRVPLVGAQTVPHETAAKFKASKCVIRPATDGTGCIAGGAVRAVLELAGVQNCLAKRLGSRSPLNNARVTIKALSQLKTLAEVSEMRGVPFDSLLLPQ